MKILLIEDDIDLSETMKFQLEKKGFRPNCAMTEKRDFIF